MRHAGGPRSSPSRLQLCSGIDPEPTQGSKPGCTSMLARHSQLAPATAAAAAAAVTAAPRRHPLRTCERDPALLRPDAELWVLLCVCQLGALLKSLQRCLELLKLVARHPAGQQQGRQGGRRPGSTARGEHSAWIVSTQASLAAAAAKASGCSAACPHNTGHACCRWCGSVGRLTPAAGMPWRSGGPAQWPCTRPAPPPSTAAV